MMRSVFACSFAIAALAAPCARAEQPTGGVVTRGAATIAQDATTTVIDQATGKVVIDWDSFNIGAGTTTRFNQPGPDSFALNRTRQPDASRLFGALEANGAVGVLNPNGVLFGPSARVDVNGLLVSTGRVDEDAFMNDDAFAVTAIGANRNAEVVNQGAITLKEGGWAALVAPRVRNEGVITAPLGRVALGAADAVTVDLRGDGLFSFRAPLARAPDGEAALVTNAGAIRVEGGVVNLSARAVEGLVESAVNQDGVVSVSSARVEGGRVILSGGAAGVVSVGGAIDARSEGAGAKGGRVVAAGALIDVKTTAKIDASGTAGGGEILIGGDKQGRPAEALGETFANAEHVRVDEGALLIADAIDAGDGGRIIVWSEGMTALAAGLSARGGAQGGDGGFIEVSGKQRLAYHGRADLRAPMGAVGELLLDPTDIQIVAGPLGGSTATLTLGATIEDLTATPSTLTTGDLLAQLALGNVTISTASGLGGAGDITVGAPIVYTGAGARALTLTADNNIAVNAGISSTAGALHVVLSATTAPAGEVVVDAAINTNGGAIAIGANGLITTTALGAITSAGGDITLAADYDASGTLADILTIGATVDAGAGDITLSGADLVLTADLLGTGDLTISQSAPALQMNLGDPAVLVAVPPSLNIGDTEFGQITGDFANLVFGRTDAAMDVRLSTATPAPAFDAGATVTFRAGVGTSTIETIRTAGADVVLENPTGDFAGLGGVGPITINTAGGDATFDGAVNTNGNVIVDAGTGAVALNRAIATGAGDATITGGSIAGAGGITTNALTMNASSISVSNLSATDARLSANSIVVNGVAANRLVLSGSTMNGSGIAANSVAVGGASRAVLAGTIAGAAGRDAAGSSNLSMAVNPRLTFNGFMSDGTDPLNPQGNDQTNVAGGPVAAPSEAPAALSAAAALPSFTGVDEDAFADLRAINELNSLSDSELLASGRGGLVAEILGALERADLGADGAPAGPYRERTALIPGVLVYDPRAGGEEDLIAVRAPVFGALEGW